SRVRLVGRDDDAQKNEHQAGQRRGRTQGANNHVFRLNHLPGGSAIVVGRRRSCQADVNRPSVLSPAAYFPLTSETGTRRPLSVLATSPAARGATRPGEPR